MLPDPTGMRGIRFRSFGRLTVRVAALIVAAAAASQPAPVDAAQPTLRRAAVDSVSVSRTGGGNGSSVRKKKSTRARATTPSARAATSTRRALRSSRASRAAAPAWAVTRGSSALASEVASALDGHTRGGEWGAIVVSLTRGDTIFSRNADAMLQPASTMKMFTAATALEELGPDFRFRTPVLRDGAVGKDGTLTGNLYFRGVGDPSITVRFWKSENPMDILAHQIVSAGIRHVRGDIVGDATAFDDQLVPDGWKTSYLGSAYAARVSALSLNEGLLWIVVQPNGDVSLDPASTTMPVKSSVRVTGGSGGRIRAHRDAEGTMQVSGYIGRSSRPRRYSLVSDNPPMYAAGALRAALEKAGVQVDGTVRLGATPAGATEVAAIGSPPLSQIVGEMDRESINIFAEMLFRATAHMHSHTVGSAQSGLANLRGFLTQKVGAPATSVDVADGSGLSMLDHVTPRAMVDLLGYVHHADWGPVFHASLPVEGESGTLKRRAKGTPARGNLHAKTGTTNTVAALGGYVTAKDGEVLAFSLIYNGADRWNAKAAMDQIGATMAAWVR